MLKNRHGGRALVEELNQVGTLTDTDRPPGHSHCGQELRIERANFEVREETSPAVQGHDKRRNAIGVNHRAHEDEQRLGRTRSRTHMVTLSMQ